MSIRRGPDTLYLFLINLRSVLVTHLSYIIWVCVHLNWITTYTHSNRDGLYTWIDNWSIHSWLFTKVEWLLLFMLLLLVLHDSFINIISHSSFFFWHQCWLIPSIFWKVVGSCFKYTVKSFTFHPCSTQGRSSPERSFVFLSALFSWISNKLLIKKGKTLILESFHSAVCFKYRLFLRQTS